LLAATASTAQAQVYGIKTADKSPDHIHPNAALFTITPSLPPAIPAGTTLTTSVTIPIQLNNNGVIADGLAINSKSDLFAYVNSEDVYTPTTSSTAQLISIRKSDGEAQAIGNALPGAWISGAAFDMSDTLWVVNGVSGQLLRIDPEDEGKTIGSPVQISIAGGDTIYPMSMDIAFDTENNAYLSMRNKVYTLNTSNGIATPLHTFPNSITTVNTRTPSFPGLALYRNEEAWFAQSLVQDQIIYSPDMDPLTLDDYPARTYSAVPDLSNDTGIPLPGTLDLAARPNRVTAKDDNVSAFIDTPVTFPVLGNDKDHWNALGVNIGVDNSGALPVNTWPKTTAGGGTVSLNSNGTLTYTPAAGFLGTDTFTYRAVAQDGSWAEATVRISVQVPVPANNPVALISLALGLVGAGGLMLRRRRRQAR
jgi:hypothetical protein